jgi:hypothetical protein
MATPPTLVQFAFAAGLDEAQQAEVLDPSAAFAALQNVRQDKRGGLSKRLGFGSLTKDRLSGSRSAGRKLLEYAGAPVVIDGSYLDVYSEAATKNVLRSRVPECTYRLQDLPLPTTFVAPPSVVQDVEHCNGFVAVTYGVALSNASSLVGLMYAAIVQASDGTVVRAPEAIGGGVAGVTVLGSYSSRYFIAFCYNDSSTALTAYYLDTQAVATGWVSIGTVAATTSNAYPAVCSLTNRVAVVYGTTSGASRVTVATYTTAGATETQTITAGSTPGKLSIDGTIADTLWVAFSQGTSVNVIGLDADALAVTRATVTTALTATTGVINLGIVEGSTAGTARAWVLSNTTPIEVDVASIVTTAGAAVATAGTTIYNALPVSRAFQQGGRYYMAFAPGPTLATVAGNDQAMCVVADWSGDYPAVQVRPVANIEPGLAPGCSFFCKFAAVSATKRIYGFQVSKSGTVSFSDIFSGRGISGNKLAELDFGSRARWSHARHGDALFLGGAVLSVFDGDIVTEAGFLDRPNKPTTSLGAGALTGTYRYVAVREAVDASGNVAFSSVSTPSDAVSPAAQNVTVSTTPLTVSGRWIHRTVFYRTDDGGEAPYYRLGVGTDGGTGAVTITDSTADVTARAKLYAPNLPGTAGEALDRRAAPGLTHVVSYNGMLVGVRGSSLVYSGQEVYGEATWFSPIFEVPVSGGGDFVGLCVLDGTLYAFKRGRVYAVVGEPPSDNGLQGGLGSPRVIASDVGCIDPGSIVATSLGVFFQSARGIELLTRAQSVEWIGEGIQTTLASYPVVSSAVLDERNSLVRFSLAATESAGAVSGNGRDVVYDLTLKAWQSVDTKYGAGAAEASQSASLVYLDSAWRYAWLGTDGTVYYERDADDASAYLDGSTWITMSAETAWLKLGGIQGQHFVNKVLLLARKSTRADLSTYLTYDYAQTPKTVMTRAANDIDTLSTAIDRIQVGHQMHDEAEGQAIKVKFEDATPTGGTVSTGKGATWIAVTFEGTPKQGAIGLPEASM